MTCAPNENLVQPGHPLSLIRIFAADMKKASCGCAGWSEPSLVAQNISLVLSSCGFNYVYFRQTDYNENYKHQWKRSSKRKTIMCTKNGIWIEIKASVFQTIQRPVHLGEAYYTGSQMRANGTRWVHLQVLKRFVRYHPYSLYRIQLISQNITRYIIENRLF